MKISITPKHVHAVLAAVAALSVAGCFDLPEEGSTDGSAGTTASAGDSSTASTPSNPPSNAPADIPPQTPPILSGALTLRMAGVPLDTAEHVYVQISGVEADGADGDTAVYYCQDPANRGNTVASKSPCTTAAAPRRIDLMALGGSQTEALLNDLNLPAGRYNGVRLMADTAAPRDTYIVVQGGAEHELVVSSGDQPRFQVNGSFDVPANGRADMVAVLDLRRSVRLRNNGDYQLVPYLRLVDNTRIGSIAGSVNAALVPGRCSPAVYVFSGDGVAPDDIDGNGAEPITSAVVKLDNGGAYRYRASFLEPGRYTVSYTCRASQDRPENGDAMEFSGTSSVTVSSQAETTHDFGNNNPPADQDDDDRKGRNRGKD